MADDIHVGDAGTKFNVTAVDNNGNPIDLSPSGSTYKYTFRKPDGSLLIATPSLLTNGKDGNLVYTTGLTDLDLPGLWRLQVYVSTSGVPVHNTDVSTFRVWPNL